MASVTDVVPASTQQQLEQIASTATALAEAYVIDSNEMAQAANDDLRKIKAEYKRVEDMRFAITRPLDEAKRQATAAFKPYLDKLAAAEGTLKGALSQWLLAEQARVRREQEEARRREQEEADRLAAQQAEAERAFDAAVEAGDAAEAERALALAEEVRAQEELQQIAPAQNVAAVQKLEGTSARRSYKVESIDLLELVQSAAEKPELLDFLSANSVEINKLVRARGLKHGIPGVKVVEVLGIAVRS